MNDGHLVAREAYSIFDVGAYLGAGPNSGVGHALGPYRIANHRLRSYGVYTNKIYVGSYRASGVADMTFAVESHMDSIAHQMGIDPVDFRARNAVREGDTSVSGAAVPRNGLLETLLAVKEQLGLPKKLPEGRGVGIALCEWRSGSGPSTAAISVNEDGTISLLTGSVDISGSDTSLAQIAAEALGLGMDEVVVAKRDTDMAPFTGPSGGSRIVYSQGKAVQLAAQDARGKLLGLAAERLGVSPEALACAGGPGLRAGQSSPRAHLGSVGAVEPDLPGRAHCRAGRFVQHALRAGLQHPGSGGVGGYGDRASENNPVCPGPGCGRCRKPDGGGGADGRRRRPGHWPGADRGGTHRPG